MLQVKLTGDSTMLQSEDLSVGVRVRRGLGHPYRLPAVEALLVAPSAAVEWNNNPGFEMIVLCGSPRSLCELDGSKATMKTLPGCRICRLDTIDVG